MDLGLLFLGYLMFDILDSDNRSTTTKVIAASVFIVLLLFSFAATFNVAMPEGDKTPKVEEMKTEDGPKPSL